MLIKLTLRCWYFTVSFATFIRALLFTEHSYMTASEITHIEQFLYNCRCDMQF